MADHGPDVSSYQGLVDWRAEKAGGATFGFAKATESVGWDDPTYRRNADGIRAAGLGFGTYHFAQPAKNSPQAEARHFLSRVQGDLRPGDRVALDLEVPLSSPRYAVDWTKAFLSALAPANASTGTKPLFYTGRSYLNWLGGAAAELVALADLWVAAYQSTPPSAAPWPAWTLWQYTSSDTEPGIRGRCDDSVARAGAFTAAVTVAQAPLQTLTITLAPEDDTVPLIEALISVPTDVNGRGATVCATEAEVTPAVAGLWRPGVSIPWTQRRSVALHGASPAVNGGQYPSPSRSFSIDDLGGFVAIEVAGDRNGSVDVLVQYSTP